MANSQPTHSQKPKATKKPAAAQSAEPDIHLFFRIVGPVAQHERGIIDGAQFDFEAGSWLKAGYRVAFAQATGLEPGALNIFILFVKDVPK